MAGQDNSFGRGFYPLPLRFSHLGRYMPALHPNKLVDYKVLLDENTWILTTKVGHSWSLMQPDMKTLIRLGLMRMQSNEPGTVSFYFTADEPAEQVLDRGLHASAADVATRFQAVTKDR